MIAILARTYADAAATADLLGLPARDWTYPQNVRSLQGVTVDRLILVDGWVQSATLDVDVLDRLNEMLTRRIIRVQYVSAPVATLAPRTAPTTGAAEPEHEARPERSPRESRRVWISVIAVGMTVSAAVTVIVILLVEAVTR